MLRKILGITLGLSLALSSQIALSQAPTVVAPIIEKGATASIAKAEYDAAVKCLKSALIAKQGETEVNAALAIVANAGIVIAPSKLLEIRSGLLNGNIDSNVVTEITKELNKALSINDRTEEVALVTYETTPLLTGWDDIIKEYPRLQDENLANGLTDKGKTRVTVVLKKAGRLSTNAAIDNAEQGTMNFVEIYPGVFNNMEPSGLDFIVNQVFEGKFKSVDEYGNVSYSYASVDTTTGNYLKYSTQGEEALVKSGVSKCMTNPPAVSPVAMGL